MHNLIRHSETLAHTACLFATLQQDLATYKLLLRIHAAFLHSPSERVV